MKKTQFKPVVALVGRPNVGKSTLFNRLTRSRNALVADFSGLTRDRHYGEGRVGSYPFLVIDTGGFEPVVKTGILKEMARQTEQAIAESDIVIFLVDARAGVNAHDHEIAALLRKTNAKIILAVNKAEGMNQVQATADFHELGLGDPIPISSAHGDGVVAMIETALATLVNPVVEEEEAETEVDIDENALESELAAAEKNEPEEEESEAFEHRIKLAIVGRPNVGKSTLINTLLGEQRVIAFDMPGTTRDAIEIDFEQGDKKYTIIDTAGLRKRGKVFESIEKFSVIKTLQAIEACNVVVLVLDAQAEISEQDAHIAGFILESGRALVVAINKWDGLDEDKRDWVTREFERKMRFLSFAKMHYISALKGHGVKALLKSVNEAHAAAFRKLSTPKLTRELRAAVEQQPPPRKGIFRPKMRYAHQGGQNPPLVIIHGNALDAISESYKRYLESRFRRVFKLEGTPMRIEFKSSTNPYKDA
ncbi:GTP-binding protein Der [Pelistega indica]|uniref:GTPase Der n=1 Tax=Pelistega indica TaxID=1414851 RepID=V8G6E8_9BURK|nr:MULTISPECIES: ribosome biogenesis GTPase Der [Pelistega]ETD72109.1 GTP-binding protein Der [Pelistega indica]